MDRQISCNPNSFWPRLYLYALFWIGSISKWVAFKGLWHFARYIGPLFVKNDIDCLIKIGADSSFQFPLLDPYWARLAAYDYEYEPEIYRFLLAAKQIPYSFLDCGANYGYWSILVSAKHLGSHPCIAIEASSNTYEKLANNCAKNSLRFQIKNRAISSADGQSVFIEKTGDHASRSISNQSSSLNHEKVETICLDTLSKELANPEEPILVKLDVEGAERASFEGAKGLSHRKDIAFLFEDHGNDPNCVNTKWILDRFPQFQVFFLTTSGRAIPIGSIGELASLKKNKSQGYNLVLAGTNSIWNSIINELR